MTQQPPPAGPAEPPDGPAPPDLPDRVARVYGELDLSTVPAFAGGFINFGYWMALPGPGDRQLTRADRVRSEEDLYRLVLGTFDLPRGGTALDVGCGRGLGCALALREFGPGTVIGLDAHPDQIARAREANAELLAASADARPGASADAPGRLEFLLGAAQDIPLPDGSVDCLFSVEAAQHFRDLPGFAREAARVLRPGGRLALTTFFARTRAAARALPALLPPYADGLDVPHVVDEVAGTLAAAGLREVRVRAIGDGVWEPYDRYMAQQPELRDDEWPRRYLTAYETGLLDYYVLTAAAG
ncbi:class I SAM-dependent methyltransferase [Streptomyces nigrescens]|uniref:class I SAM-dependent methyltransferase n=1 Tax=Streptomyces nigrescens TaxID=1920 RepID=UPI0036FE87FE